MPPLTSAARGRTVCAPTEKKKKRAVNVFWEKESPRRFAAPPFDKGGFGGRGTSGEPLGLPFKSPPSSASHALGTFP